MSFILPDLVVESVIREGLEALRRDETITDDVFGNLDANYVFNKYGQKEITAIKSMIQKRDIGVVHSFGEVGANAPCFSIQLGKDDEDKPHAHLDDFEEDRQESMTDPEDLANLVVVSSVAVTAYDSVTGVCSVDDSTDISNVHVNLLYVDADETEHVILGGIIDATGSKQFIIDKGATVNFATAGEIKSSINYKQYTIRGIRSDVSLMIGIHAKDALVTKYLYIVLKYILASRKEDLINRCFDVSSFSGSDFTRNLQYEGDIVYNRFYTLTGEIEDSWKAEQVIPIDLVEPSVLVDIDSASAEDLEQTNQTVKTGTNPQE